MKLTPTIKYLIIITLLFGLPDTAISMNTLRFIGHYTDSISPKTNIKEQLTSKEIKAVVIKDIHFNANTCFQLMQGVIYNKGDHKPMHNVNITLSLNNRIVQEITTDKTGRYQLKLLCNKTYDLRLKIVGFEDQIITFKSDIKSNTTIKKDFELSGAYCYQTISGTIVSQTDNSLLNNATVKLLHNKKLLKTVKTFEDGTYSFNLECYKSYSIEVTKENHLANAILFNTSLVPQTILVKHITLKRIYCSKTIQGTVLSKASKSKLRNVIVSLSKDGVFIKKTLTNSLGKFNFDMPCNVVYTLVLEKENYSPVMRAIESDSNKNDPKYIEVILTKTDCKQILSGIVKNSETNKPESNVVLQLFNKQQLISETSSTSDGSYSFNAECYKPYKITSSKKYFNDGVQYLRTGHKNNAEINKIIKISPITDFIEVRGIQMLKLNPNNLTFIINKNKLTAAMIKELQKIIILMEKHPYINLEINVHTDSRANDNLNMSLSKGRANTINDYLVSKGISQDRLTAQGYGETQLINKCANGVKCSNIEHMKNRRIHFIVLNN